MDAKPTRTNGKADVPVFVVGVERSGTTLLRVMLDSHPELAVPPESLFIPRAWEVRRRFTSSSGFDAEGMTRLIFDQRRMNEWDLPVELVLDRIRRLEQPDFAQMVACFFETYADHVGKPRWGDKTPTQLMSISLLSSLFPTARFVHLIRDGRNVALSLWRAPFGPSTLPRAADRWAYQVAKGRAQGAALGADRYIEIRYEDLVQDSESVLTAICDFCDLSYSPEMLRYNERWQDVVPTRIHGHMQNLAKPPTRTRSFQDEMAPSEIALVECLQGSALDALGYERTVPTPPIPSRVQALGVRCSVVARRSVFAGERLAFHALRRPGLPRPRSW